MSTYNKRNASKHQKTMESILSFLRCVKGKRYGNLNQLLYDIRTNDLREMLPELGREHLFYRTLLDILRNEQLDSCHCEALYNLAVVLGEKSNVASLVRHGALEVVLLFKDTYNPQLLHNACWCLFGISASSPEMRELCLQNGVLDLAIHLMITSQYDIVIDQCGQILYGIFHMRPIPPSELIQPFYDNASELLKLPEGLLKYVLWAIHFATTGQPEIVDKMNIANSVKPLIKSQQATILIPLIIIIGEFFKREAPELIDFIGELKGPLTHFDTNVRLQACRTVADYVRNEKTVENMLQLGLYDMLIKISKEDDSKVQEQAVYGILRGFGLGSEEQKKRLANLGGLQIILNFSVIAISPFNCNLLDCLDSLINENYEFFSNKLKEVNAVPVLYKLLSSTDQIVNSKAANILGMVGDDYNPDQW